MGDQIWIALIVMGGIVLAIVAWQILSIGKAAMEKKAVEDVEDLRRRVRALEARLGVKSEAEPGRPS